MHIKTLATECQHVIYSKQTLLCYWHTKTFGAMSILKFAHFTAIHTRSLSTTNRICGRKRLAEPLMFNYLLVKTSHPCTRLEPYPHNDYLALRKVNREAATNSRTLHRARHVKHTAYSAFPAIFVDQASLVVSTALLRHSTRLTSLSPCPILSQQVRESYVTVNNGMHVIIPFHMEQSRDASGINWK